MRHQCSAGTRRAIYLQQLNALLDLPYRWVEDTHGYTKLLRVQEEAEAIEDEFRRQHRCVECGLKL